MSFSKGSIEQLSWMIAICLVVVLGCKYPKAASTSADLNAGLSSTSTSVSPSDSPEAIQLFDITADTGITFVHDDGSFGKFLLPETMCGGLALFDYDLDGLVDIYFCNGSPLDVHSAESGKGNVLYKNLGRLRFRDVSSESGLDAFRFCLGVTIGDFDNDGFPDVYLSNFGSNSLYRNDGDGHYVNVSSDEVSLGDRFSAGASFLDANGDGNLDLFVANYVQFSSDDIQKQSQLSRSMYPGPQDFPPESNALLLNLGNGQWQDVSHESQISSQRGTGMSCIAGDFDSDLDVDVYVANDELPNFFFANDGSGVFVETAVSLGIAVDAMGAASGSMGVDAGDLDNDGRDDLFVTTFENELVNLYRMTNHQIFQDVTRQTQVGNGTHGHVTWGCCIADLENDGDRDLFIASGHLDKRRGDGFYATQNLVMKNLLCEQGKFLFTNVTERCGNLANVRHCSRGSAVADLDNDGDLDVVVQNLRERPSILENRASEILNGWITLELVGAEANRDAVGTKVRVYAGQQVLVDEVRNGRGYQSYWGKRLHFGLGDNPLDRIEIDWIDGQRQVLHDCKSDHHWTIIEANADRGSMQSDGQP